MSIKRMHWTTALVRFGRNVKRLVLAAASDRPRSAAEDSMRFMEVRIREDPNH